MADKLRSSKTFIAGRGEDFCRGCLGTNLFSALDLGQLPIANELLLVENAPIEKFSLHLRICSKCGLGQVADVVPSERIFRDYRYLSSISSTFLQHAKDFVSQQMDSGRVSSGDWVLEIASNDGYLLQNFLPYKIKVIGVEPAENVAKISRELGIQTIPEFFTSQLASDILMKNGYPKLIVANNVLAHVPDLLDFVRGLSILCGPETQISIENPSLSNILVDMQFDTIYHEHYSYLSANAVHSICRSNNLMLHRIEEFSIHGGSIRYWLRNLDCDARADQSVERMIKEEKDISLFKPETWESYSSKVDIILKGFKDWIEATIRTNRKIYGYGAAAKASTILNAVDVGSKSILAIADSSLEKQKRFMPPHRTKIISPQELFNAKPTDVIIFPWNIKTEIASFLRTNLGKDVRLWCTVPEMHELLL